MGGEREKGAPLRLAAAPSDDTFIFVYICAYICVYLRIFVYICEVGGRMERGAPLRLAVARFPNSQEGREPDLGQLLLLLLILEKRIHSIHLSSFDSLRKDLIITGEKKNIVLYLPAPDTELMYKNSNSLALPTRKLMLRALTGALHVTMCDAASLMHH